MKSLPWEWKESTQLFPGRRPVKEKLRMSQKLYFQHVTWKIEKASVVPGSKNKVDAKKKRDQI